MFGLLLFFLAQLMTTQDILKMPAPPADHRIPYGDDPLQFGDLRLPKGAGPYPVVMVIHGGCWQAQYDLAHIGNLSAALTKAGAATWTIEYRRIGNPGGGWPGTLDDVVKATGYVKILARTYPLDLKHVVAVGHSAGGHLALYAASRHMGLSGAVSLAGVVDLRRAAKEHVCGDAASQLVDGQADRYAKASPIELLPLGVPTRLVHGVEDKIVPVAFSKDYEIAAHKAGDNVRTMVVEKAGHFELIAPGSSAWKTVETTVMELLRNP